MNSTIVFRTEARVEFDAAADWYEQHSRGRGQLFVEAVHSVLDRISDQPQMYAAVFNGIREARVTGYPYCIYYREEHARVTILAVFHTSRDPAIWQDRIVPPSET